MAASPAQPDQKQRNLEAELDALLTQIQKDIPDLSKDAPPSTNSPPNLPPHSPAPSSTPAKASSAPSAAKSEAAPDLVDEQLAAQIQAMLDDASAQLAQGKTPAQITEETLARQLPPEPPLAPATIAEAPPIERLDTPRQADDSGPGYHRELGQPTLADEPHPADDAGLSSLDEDLAKKANVEISGEFAPVHEVIQETTEATAPDQPAGEKVSADDIDALIAQAVSEASGGGGASLGAALGGVTDESKPVASAPPTSPPTSPPAAPPAAPAPLTEPLPESAPASRTETEPVAEQGTAEQVASELDDQLAASADVEAIDGDFESVHEIPPSPPPTPTSSTIAAAPPPPAPAQANSAASESTATKSDQPKVKPAKAPKEPKPAGPPLTSLLLKPVYAILTLINAPLAGLSPSARNLVGFIGIITLLNAVALILWKLSTSASSAGH